MRNNQPQYDFVKKKRAAASVTFRVLVSVYLIYLGCKLATGGGEGIPVIAAVLIGLAFIAAAAGFIIYSLRVYRADLKAAELTEDDMAEAEANEKEQ